MFKVGDKVRLADTEDTWFDYGDNPRFNPKPGTTGTIRVVDSSGIIAIVCWNDKETLGDHTWCALVEDLVLENDAAGAANTKNYFEQNHPEDPFEIINFYRKLYYKEDPTSERGIMANAINEGIRCIAQEYKENE